MEIGRLRTADGNEIEITQNMLEDFIVLSDIYNVSIRDLIRNVFDCELDADHTAQMLKRKAG